MLTASPENTYNIAETLKNCNMIMPVASVLSKAILISYFLKI